MKGVSAVIAAILMLMITIALGGSAYYVFSITFGGKTETGFTVVGKDQNTISIRNEGTMPITKNMVSVVVDGAQAVIEDSDSLVGYWNFDEGSGTTAKDSSKYGNHGTLNYFDFNANSGWAAGRHGNALRFDGVNDYVDAGNSGASSPITMSVWVKPATLAAATWYGVMMNGYESSIWIYNGGFNVRLHYPYGDNVNLASGYSLTVGKWSHLVFTYDKDAASPQLRSYADGIARNTAETTVATVAETVRLGNSMTAHYYDGLIDEVRIYNRVLSPEEVKSLYECNEIICIMPGKTGTVKILNPLYAGKHDVEICISNTCVRDTITTS